MKKYPIVSVLLFLIFPGIIIGQGLIIDHTCKDLNLIPSEVIEDVKDNIKLHYAHTSHGVQIICGLESVEASDSLYGIEYGLSYLPNVEDKVCIFDGQEDFTYVTPEGYWRDEGWQLTQDVLNHNPEINISMWEWCTQPEYYPVEGIQAYLDSISSFEEMFPDVTFIYTTSNAQATNSFGYTRHQNNNMIRQFCIDNNKILFDFGDLDCWYNGEMNYYLFQGDTIPAEHSAYAGDECGHTNNLSALQKGKAMWWMLAKLSGWNQNKLVLNAKVFLEGPTKGGASMDNFLNIEGYLPLIQPYNTYPWNYYGDESVAEIPSESAIDWVLVELRDAEDAPSATSSTIADWQVGFLLDNGNIVSLSNEFLEFETVINESLFIVVRHRNHIGVMSAFPVIETGGVYNYDFTSNASMAYGGVNACKEVSPGIWGMIGGDGESNGNINSDDHTHSWMPQSGKKGYYSGDFNMNGQVNNVDKDDIWTENLGIVELVPE